MALVGKQTSSQSALHGEKRSSNLLRGSAGNGGVRFWTVQQNAAHYLVYGWVDRKDETAQCLKLVASEDRCGRTPTRAKSSWGGCSLAQQTAAEQHACFRPALIPCLPPSPAPGWLTIRV